MIKRGVLQKLGFDVDNCINMLHRGRGCYTYDQKTNNDHDMISYNSTLDRLLSVDQRIDPAASQGGRGWWDRYPCPGPGGPSWPPCAG